MNLKDRDQIRKMREAGLVLWHAHVLASHMVLPGTTTKQIDVEIENFIVKHKAVPMFKGVPGPVSYPAASCISVNDQVVHGIPSDRKLTPGDIVSIDIGVKLDGWCADAAVTYPVGDIDPKAEALLALTEETLRRSLILLKTEAKWSDVVRKTSEQVYKAGFSIVKELAGHAIGQQMWEKPVVPNYYHGNNPDFNLRPGLVLAIEPMVNAGTREVETLADHWTIVTKDGKNSAHFEHTVAITEHGPEVLTCGPNGEGWAL